MKVFPENILKCMSPEDRRKAGQKMAAEVMAQGEAKSEKELQRAIVGLLRLKGIEPLVPAFGKKTRISAGWPDITFCIYALAEQFPASEHQWPLAWQTFPCLWEIKMPKGYLTAEQEALHDKLRRAPNGWRVRVIRSVDQALEELRGMGIS